MPSRPGLSHQRIIDAAIAVADDEGLARATMRGVASRLGVEAMSLYHHVANKDALLDALADAVYRQIDLPSPTDPWREAMARRARSARDVLGGHPWAIGLIESRPSPPAALLRHHEAVLANLFAHGFSVHLASNAFSMLDAYIYGFVITEANLPFSGETGEVDFAAEVALDPAEYPALARVLGELLATPDYHFANEFESGLSLILDGLELRLNASRAAP